MISYRTEDGSPVVEVRVEGHVSNLELEDIMSRLRDDLEQHGKHRILEIIEDFTGIQPSAVWTDVRLGIPLANMVDRVAVVADQGWIRAMTNLGHFFTRAEIRSFEPSAAAEARSWINEAV